MKKLFTITIAILATAAMLTSCSKTQDDIDKETVIQMAKDVVGDKFKLESVKSDSLTIADEIDSENDFQYLIELNKMKLTSYELDSLLKLKESPELKPKVSHYDSKTIARYIYVVEYRVEGIKKEMRFIKFNPTKYDKTSLLCGTILEYDSESLSIKIKRDQTIEKWKKLNGEFPIITLYQNFKGKYIN
jgi:hypothetical protein